MKLLIDIDETLFDSVKELTKAKTKKEAIVISLRAYLKNHEKTQFVKMMQGYRHGMTLRQLQKIRRQWKRY